MNEYSGSRVNSGSMVSHILLSNPAAAACQFLPNIFVFLVRSPDVCQKALSFANEFFVSQSLISQMAEQHLVKNKS